VREYSTPALVDIPASANLSDVVFRRAADEPGAVIMRRKGDGGGWRDVTAREFRDEVMALAKGLIAAGIQAGDRVALMSRTRYEWTLIDYAIWSAGAVTVPIYETSSAEQVEWIISNSGARAVFAETATHEATIASVRAQLPHLEMTWRIDGEAAQGDGEGGMGRRAGGGGRGPGGERRTRHWRQNEGGAARGCDRRGDDARR
jgi:long-chain acyl-CoA synthetase